MIKKTIALLLLLPLLYLLQLGARMFHEPTIISNEQGIYSEDVYQQLQFLKKEIHGGAGTSMQNIYPEGYVFLHALYALSWANLVQETEMPSLRKEASEEMQWSIARLESDTARAIFPEDMFLPYGVYYQGWLNNTRARYLALQRDTIQQKRFQDACHKLADAVERHHTPFLFSYHHASWPADNILAMAALAEHDQLFEPSFQQVNARWLTAMQTKLDTNGLIPHAVDLTYGNSVIAARGSSQSLMLALLPKIDTTFAQQQFARYRELFVDERLGLPGIREYPKGTKGQGDIDAGPVIWQIGGAASVVGMGTVGQYSEVQLYQGLRNSVEGFAMATTWGGRKRYLLGKLPMADAFIAWSHSGVPLTVQATNSAVGVGKFLMYVAALVILVLLLMKRLWKKSSNSVP